MAPKLLELRGFNADRGRFLLTTTCTDARSNEDGQRLALSASTRILERDLVDLQTWDRLLHRTSPGAGRRLPTKRLRKLMAASWVRGDRAAGWRIELLKNVSACEEWINAAFAMLPAAQQLEFLDDELYAAAKHKRMAARAESKHARDLQQYFTSAELVDLVVQRVLAQLQLQSQQPTNIVWLEPSCGDGRFLTALLGAGATHVVGYEIDERLHPTAQQNVQRAAKDAANKTATEELRAQVILGDFLASKSAVSASEFVVAIGNPPFGAKGGDGSDLVHLFFRHAATEWRARVIAFIVPERCSRRSFVETTLQHLSGQHNHSSDGGGELASLQWELVMELPLTDHQFEFGEGDMLKRVRQPSVLQLFIRGQQTSN